ncbi:Metallo-dependent phosphatase-like protein [Scheffersomyces amazonensis]|uniref:Metallo-dependent phosphatase-like protein n=1 Tax=Scheffersomyces amazonensis TaxID=1078765 RepID=UPI00315DAC4E
MSSKKAVTNSLQINNALKALDDKPNELKRFDIHITESGEEKSTKERYITNVEYPVDYLPTEQQLFSKNGLPNCEFLKNHFIRQGRLHESHAIKIINDATELLINEPNLLDVMAPITVCGDIHGQYYDLMKLFEVGGDPATTKYLFLGDYVDRGFFSSECLLYLYALKLNYPDKIFMLRGNHECGHLTDHFTFKAECLHKYSIDFYEECLTSFNALPLAAIMNKQFFCVHGGLSPDLKSLDDIQKLDRFIEPPHSGLMCDLLWADPIEDYDEDVSSHAFVRNVTRGCSYAFTYKASCNFLERTQLLSVIRAHEAQDTGYRMYKRTKKMAFPSVLTLFSAPNYLDCHHNKAAVLKYDGSVMNIRQFECQPHPYYLPDFKDVFTWSLPFVGEKVLDMLLSILNICTEEELEEDTPFIEETIANRDEIDDSNNNNNNNNNNNEEEKEEAAAVVTTITKESDESIEAKRIALRNKVIAIGRMSRMFQVLREESESVAQLKSLNSGILPKGSLLHGSDGLQQTIMTFQDARKADMINEALPPTPEQARQSEKERTERARKDIESGQNSNPVFHKLIRRLSEKSTNS